MNENVLYFFFLDILRYFGMEENEKFVDILIDCFVEFCESVDLFIIRGDLIQGRIFIFM